MTMIFFIYSATVDITNYTIKDIPGSSGRLDVISRCILAGLLGNNDFDKDIQVWVFLDKYGGFLFDTNVLNFETFPKNELMLSDYFVEIIKNRHSKNKLENNPLRLVRTSEKGAIEALKELLELNYKAYILHEKGNDFFSKVNDIIQEKEVIFIVGNQSNDIMNLKELLAMDLPQLSLGDRSYLASSVIRLIKLNLLTLL